MIFLLASTPGAANSQRKQKVPAVLLAVCKRWQNVAVNTPGLWNNLSLHWDEGSALPVDDIATWLLRGQTKPLSFKYTGYFIRVGADLEMRIPWSNLTNLEMDGQNDLHLHQVRKILAVSVNLEFCKLDQLVGWKPCRESLNEIVVAPSTVPHLRALSITLSHIDRTNQVHPLFLYLTLPALEHIELSASAISVDLPLVDTLTELLERSQFKLKTFKLVNVLVNQEELLELLTEFTELKHLHLESFNHGYHQYDRLFVTMTYNSSNLDNALRNLEQLVIIDLFPHPAYSSTSDVEAVSFLESRRWRSGVYPHNQTGLSQLKDVLIFWIASVDCDMYYPDEALLSRVQALRNNGMNLWFPSRQPQQPSTLGSDFWGPSVEENPVVAGRTLKSVFPVIE